MKRIGHFKDNVSRHPKKGYCMDIHRKPSCLPKNIGQNNCMLTQMNLKQMILSDDSHSDHEPPNKKIQTIKYQTFTHHELKNVITKTLAISPNLFPGTDK